MSFKQGQKVDVLMRKWRVGYIRKVYYNNKHKTDQHYLVGVDGMDISFRKSADDIAKLNTHTIRHYHSYHPKSKICHELTHQICQNCHKKCCFKCNICQFDNQFIVENVLIKLNITKCIN